MALTPGMFTSGIPRHKKGHLLTLKDLRDDSKNPLQKTTPKNHTTPLLHPMASLHSRF